MFRTEGLVFLLVALMVTPALAQTDDDAPVTLPTLKRDDVLVVPVTMPKGLPQGVVATVDDKSLTQADLLAELLKTNLNTIASALLTNKMVELEMQRNGVEVSEEELQEQLKETLEKMTPGKTFDEVVESGIYSAAYLRNRARIERGWNKLFWAAKNISEDKRADQVNQFLMQIYMNEVKARYQMAIRGTKPEPPKGAIAALNTIIKGRKVSYVVDASEAMELMVGVLRPVDIVRGQDDMIEGHLVQREMAKADATVTDSEVEAWVRAMTEKYPPPFTWETILRLKGTSPDRERRRWRQVQSWKRATNRKITQEELDRFVEEHEDFFRSRHVKVAHILVKTVDDLTGLPFEGEKLAEAEEKIQKIYGLAREGVDFGSLATRFSDDIQTAKNKGNMPQPIKKWGGGYDKAFQDIAYKLEKGELSKPVKTQFGWHVIMCVEENPATNRQIDWREDRYAEWILEEFETFHMTNWLDSLTKSAKIEKSAPAELLEIKNVKFPENAKP